MIIGILSDNHGHLEPVRRALELFDARNVEVLVHCGDVGGLETLELIAPRPCRFVWGNMDDPEPSWRSCLAAWGLHWPEAVPVVVPAADKSVAVCHGHEAEFRGVCHGGAYDYVLHGHTHQQADHRQGQTRIINPGALHRAATRTVAVLDTDSDQLQFLPIRR